MSNFRSGYLQQGYPLGNLTLDVSLSDNVTWLNVETYGMVRIYSDNLTPAARTIQLTDGSVVGQNLLLINVGATGSLNLQDEGNVALTTAQWVPLLQYDNLTLVWTGALWVETARAVNT